MFMFYSKQITHIHLFFFLPTSDKIEMEIREYSGRIVTVKSESQSRRANNSNANPVHNKGTQIPERIETVGSPTSILSLFHTKYDLFER